LGTIENPGPLQRAFLDEQAAQCGYCIAGMIMRAQALLEAKAAPTEDEIRRHMMPNGSRSYTNSLRLIHRRSPERSNTSRAIQKYSPHNSNHVTTIVPQVGF
jgi:aerobic-type carbon monoxide dehydrogenase small subunit (CoxS/CutS family)